MNFHDLSSFTSSKKGPSNSTDLSPKPERKKARSRRKKRAKNSPPPLRDEQGKFTTKWGGFFSTFFKKPRKKLRVARDPMERTFSQKVGFILSGKFARYRRRQARKHSHTLRTFQRKKSRRRRS